VKIRDILNCCEMHEGKIPRKIPKKIIEKSNVVLIDGRLVKDRGEVIRAVRYGEEEYLNKDIKQVHVSDLPDRKDFAKIASYSFGLINIITS